MTNLLIGIIIFLLTILMYKILFLLFSYFSNILKIICKLFFKNKKYYHDFKNDQFVNEYIYKNKKNGYFVEIGAVDGINFSQCYFFEKNLGWNGIAVEPQKQFNNKIKKNRKQVCLNCIGDQEKIVNFTESTNCGLSGITNILLNHEKTFENHKNGWRDGKTYNVKMITLIKLLKKFNAPRIIDYLALDCEGSEFNILKNFFINNNFYRINFIAVEVGRIDLIKLILENNYIELINPILPKYKGGNVTWEKYFIHKSLINTIDENLIKNI